MDDIKRDTLDLGELAASAFTTIFIVSGLFGITAGLVLIFLIFVMLAAERKSEMGMARAVGAQRGRLVEMFVFEGTAYDLVAAAVGVALGVATGLIVALTLGRAFAGTDLDHPPKCQLPQPAGVLFTRHAGDLCHRAHLRQPRQPPEHRVRHPRSAGATATTELPERPPAGAVPGRCRWLPGALSPAHLPRAAPLADQLAGQSSAACVVGVYKGTVHAASGADF